MKIKGYCKECEYIVNYYNGEEEKMNSECHRFPPNISVMKYGYGLIHTHSAFPYVNKEDYCAEFQEKK